MTSNTRFSKLMTRALAIVALVRDVERDQARLSSTVCAHIQSETLYILAQLPALRKPFAANFKSTAVNMFRHRRYISAERRYKLASICDPTDVTLVSNRVVCLFNVHRYRECIDICQKCLQDFPSALFANPDLHFKLLVRMGRAHIELKDFNAADRIISQLHVTRAYISNTFQITVPDSHFNSLIAPYQRHLTVSRAAHAANPIPPPPPLHHSIDSDSDEDEGDDDLPTLILDHTCRHIFPNGDGPCIHPFYSDSMDLSSPANFGVPLDAHPSDQPTEFAISLFPDDSDEDSLPQSQPDSPHPPVDCLCPACVPEDFVALDPFPLTFAILDESGDPGTQICPCRCPDCMSQPFENDKQEDDSDLEAFNDAFGDTDDEEEEEFETLDEFEEYMRRRFPKYLHLSPDSDEDEVVLTPFEDKQSDGSRRLESAPGGEEFTSSNPLPATELFQKTALQFDSASSGLLLNNTGSSGNVKKPARKQVASSGFKRGFLNEDSKNHPSFTNANTAKETNSDHDAYETDEEDGPISAGINCIEQAEEAASLYHQANRLRTPQSANSNNFDVFFKRVMGKQFQPGAIDFARMFGPHATAKPRGKRKKRTCEVGCAQCFARKMWKARFISNSPAEALASFKKNLSDPRRDPVTFLSKDLWGDTGYYGSGYEQAFHMTGLVHSVAYIAHLQSEIFWCGDDVSMEKDIQYRFISAIEEFFTDAHDVQLLFAILHVLRHTVSLFDFLPDPDDKEAKQPFQFSKIASQVVQNVWKNSLAAGGPSTSRSLLGTSQDLLRTANNWALTGHVAKEEIWIYRLLLRDVSQFVMSLFRPDKIPAYLYGKRSTSEALRTACMSKIRSEKYWKCRIVGVIAKQRSRCMERDAVEAMKSGDFGKSENLLRAAICVRGLEPRLYWKLGKLHSKRQEWNEALRDMKTAEFFLVNAKDPPQRALMAQVRRSYASIKLEAAQETSNSTVKGGR